MFAKRSLGGIWKPKNPHSLEYLKYLHGVLNKNAVVTENNRSLLVEALRAIAEILIWGDQNDPSVFDFFLEKNMLGFFLRIMKQKCGRYVCTQLLQTLNILFENISNETSLYYLLSNNHVNSIITHRFDFSDEEILAYYISFLKTLSLKLNNNTIHFFFNEHTNDFPLYTEAIKFFNHPESMVRIAVRTLTLNVYRVFSVPVNDSAMLNFIRDNAAAPYFSNFVHFIANHVVDIDSCLSSAETSGPHTRDKLSDLMAEHLDHIHYMNDVLCLNIDSLNALLTDQLLKKLLIPIYLGCLSPEYRFDGAARVSPVVALFLLSQVFLVVTHTPLVERLAGLLMLGDQNALCNEGAVHCSSEASSSANSNKTDEEKLKTQSPRGDDPLTTPDALSSRPLLKAVLDSLDCGRDDHAAFFSLCLVFAIYQNSGISPALLQCAQLSADNTTNGTYCAEIIRRLLGIISQSVQKECKVRVATLETCCATFKQILCNSDGQYNSLIDQFLADLVLARETIIAQLRHYAEREELFLDLFEDEYRQIQTRNFSIDLLSTDASMLLPPSDTPLSGVDFVKRLPCGPQEHARRAIRIFLLIRQLLQDISGEEDDFHRTFSSSPIVKVDDCLNLNNSDLLACTVVMKDGSKYQRFLVTGGLQLMLVEPDTKKLGWGVVRFAGFLQDCEVAGDKEDSRALAITVLAPAAKARANSPQLLSARLIFDDHIRCMAAKQRLTKGRQKARQYKMDVISHLLELRGASENAGEILLPPPPLLSSVVGRQVPGYVAVDHSRRREEGEETKTTIPVNDTAPEQRKVSTGSSSGSKQPSKRRVRVLSAEHVANDRGQQSNEPEPEENVEKVELEESKWSNAEAPLEGVPGSAIGKRSSSLSPRVVPRFGMSYEDQKTPPVEKKSVVTSATVFFGRSRPPSSSSSTNRTTKEEPAIEMKRVEVREDPGLGETSAPSLQCFAGKRKVSSQVLDI